MGTPGAAGSEAEKLVTSLLSFVESLKTGLEETIADYKKTDLNYFLTYYHDLNHGIMKLAGPIYKY